MKAKTVERTSNIVRRTTARALASVNEIVRAIAFGLVIASCSTTTKDTMTMRTEPGASALSGAEMISFLPTADGARCRAFYEGKLKFSVLSDDSHFLLLETGGDRSRRIRVQKLQKLTPQSFTILGWDVRDIDATITELASSGVPCEHFPGVPQNERGIMDFPDGTRVAWFKDPDGNILSIAQMPR
jgi:predicted enzyme related to lactoylglutathione lyase